MDYIGQYAVIHLVLHVVCICIAYWALQSIRLDQFYCRFVTILDAGKIFNKISLTL